MAANLPFKVITLDGNDVPGAILPFSHIEENTREGLLRFLNCRGVKPSNKRKSYLSVLVRDIIEKKIPIDPSIDGGKWLQEKANKLRFRDMNVASSSASDSVPVFDTIPITGWKKFPSRTIPTKFHHGSIHHHIVTTAVMVYDDSDSESSGKLFGTHNHDNFH